MLFSFMLSAHAAEEKAQVKSAEVAAEAATAESTKKVEDPFDKNNDGKIDATDWKSMDEKEKHAYARKMVTSLGQDPDSELGGLGTREELYLKGLKSQFEADE